MKFKEYPSSIWHSVRLRLNANEQSNHSTPLPVIVSLTSIPSRLKTLDITILSLLAQTALPEKIIVWLNEDWKSLIPKRLLTLQGDIFEIRFCEGTSSYRKLLPTLQTYSNQPIITVDDDVIYPAKLIETLFNGHSAKPNDVVCQYAREIKRHNGQLLPYKEWRFLRHEARTGDNLLPIGEGGVLYPPHCFNNDVFDEDIYTSCAPTADDLWFKAQSLLNNKSVTTISEIARPIPIIASQKISLKKTNIKKDKNIEQWERLCEQYPRLLQLF